MERHVIIGSGSGIGAALARQLAGPGVSLLLHTGSNAERLAGVAEACRVEGAEVETCLGRTEDAGLFAAVEDWAGQQAGPLTGLTFAAGYAKLGKIDDTPHEPLATALAAMPVAFHRLCAMLSPRLEDRRGRIVCVSAFGAHRAKTHSYLPTAPAKAALEAQVRVIAANLAPRGITVNAVVPGFIEKEPGTPSSLTPAQWEQVTAGIPMARVGQRDEVAALARFLLSAPAGYVTGQSIHANGGLTL
ncbi:SDR family NAD(P)-dependent oxidoreductase [Salipiger mucosus]|uniref:Dehydrogenase with different specificity n=1 Tax=Salipiger mucosus DSM 16094 TaxID=1123237 RepID=S9R133_9RHOB|nr:SDR family oxidoreductase [Salipiger mucosus]EPX85638.1 Dehydrogenase with different specificity [Salipiger mucosus DSM 16094]